MGVALIAIGFLGLVPGVLGIFEGREFFGVSSWALTILGGLFFLTGIGLVQSIGSTRSKA